MKKIDRNDREVIELDRGQPWARRIHLLKEDAPSVIVFRLSLYTLIIPCALEIGFVFIGGAIMKLVPNPSFDPKNIPEGSKGVFTCANCGKEFKEKVKRLEGYGMKVVCPFCGCVYAGK